MESSKGDIGEMKILVLCNHGNVRSVGLKYLIQRLYDHDVLAAGVEENTDETLAMLGNWADKIITLTPMAKEMFIESVLIDVGRDVWFNPFHHNLQHKLLKHIKELDL
jgi:galactitol-specific phosphotransferase system IIB component